MQVDLNTYISDIIGTSSDSSSDDSIYSETDNNIKIQKYFQLLCKNRNAEVPYFMQPPVTIKMSLKNILEVNDIYPIEHNNLKNHLILFLSNLPHLVTPNEIESPVPRRSISFNTFWKGAVGQYLTQYDGLNTIDYKEVLFLKGSTEIINNTIIGKRK
jgi:hypothetical protein